jgi:hypothetical protein
MCSCLSVGRGLNKTHGMNLQIIASPNGTILWVSGPLPGSIYNIKCARIWGILRALQRAGLLVLADKRYKRSRASDHSVQG